MSETQQQTVFGEPIEEQAHIGTTGRVIRPFKRMVDEVASEYRLEFSADGLRVAVVDPSNVIMLDVTLFAEAFDEYELEGQSVYGVFSDALGSALGHARYGKSTDDPVEITVDDRHLETEVTREIGETDATINERIELMDPASIREYPDIPALDVSVEAALEPASFIEVTKHLDTDDTVSIGSDSGGIVFKQEGATQRNIRLQTDTDGVAEWTHYSGGYIESLANVLQNGYVDNLTLRWDEDMPLFVDFERTDHYTGTAVIAPRVRQE